MRIDETGVSSTTLLRHKTSKTDYQWATAGIVVIHVASLVLLDPGLYDVPLWAW